MIKYALWYFEPGYGNYATFDTNVPVSRLADLGFDYIIVLHALGKDGEYGQVPMSGYSYEDGYNDARQLAQWLEQEVNPDLPYLVEIPVLVKDDKEQWELFKNSNYTIKPAVRGIDYWKGWVDGIYTNTGGLQRGFYWNLEFPWQVVRGIVYENDISALSSKIMGWGEEFIWIPPAHEGINLEHTDIKRLSKYFTYVFAQPNYYQGETTDFKKWFNIFKSFKKEHHLDNLFVEMECDGKVRSHDSKTAAKYKERACAYVKYTKDYPHRAYYYDANIQNIQEMEEYCNDKGKKYVF